MLCPKCNHDDFPLIPNYLDKSTWPRELISITSIDTTRDVLDGVSGLLWKEEWECPNCGQKFFYVNSNI